MRIMSSVLLVWGILSGAAFSQTAPNAGGWREVDGLAPGTPVVVTLTTGDRHSGRFHKATPLDLTLTVKRGAFDRPADETLPKSLVRTVTTSDPQRDGALRGSLIGAGGAVALFKAELEACRTGCESGEPRIVPLAAIVGAGIGAAVGWVADRDADAVRVLYPIASGTAAAAPKWTRPRVRLGPTYRQMSFASREVAGSVAAPGMSFDVQISPHLSTQIEYSSPAGRLFAAPGSVPDSILQNVVPASSRAAGRSRGIESRRVSFVFSELVGIHPPPIGRVRLGFLAGVSVQGRENRDYYDANQDGGQGTASDPRRTFRLPGKYYVLDFASPQTGPVVGVDAAIPLGHRLEVVPSIRYTRVGRPGPTMAYGATAQWRF